MKRYTRAEVEEIAAQALRLAEVDEPIWTEVAFVYLFEQNLKEQLDRAEMVAALEAPK